MSTEQNDQSTSVNISSNTLFHFTSSKKRLVSIIKNGFYPHYCLETFRINDRRLGKYTLEYAIPMVSFCDLPLFLIRKHLETYGGAGYGIGLRKLWGIRKGVSRVLYVHEKSDFLKKAQRVSEGHHRRQSHNPGNKASLSLLAMSESFIKTYQGSIWRNGKYKKGIRFYNEREWRFVPNTISRHLAVRQPRDSFFDSEFIAGENQKLSQAFPLKFGQRDIMYIIVKNDREARQMVADLKKIRYLRRHVEILTSCIMTKDVILED